MSGWQAAKRHSQRNSGKLFVDILDLRLLIPSCAEDRRWLAKYRTLPVSKRLLVLRVNVPTNRHDVGRLLGGGVHDGVRHLVSRLAAEKLSILAIASVRIGKEVDGNAELRFKFLFGVFELLGLDRDIPLGQVQIVVDRVTTDGKEFVFRQLLQRVPSHLWTARLATNKAGVDKHRRRVLVLLKKRPSVVVEALVVVVEGENDRLLRHFLPGGEVVIEVLRRDDRKPFDVDCLENRLELLNGAVVPEGAFSALCHKVVEHQNRNASGLGLKADVIFQRLFAPHGSRRIGSGILLLNRV